MRRVGLALALLAVLPLIGCGDYEIVDKSQQVILSKAEYRQLKADADLGKQVGRYRFERYYPGVWREDTATGENCLLDAGEDYWKTAGALAMACPTEPVVKSHRDAQGNPIPESGTEQQKQH